MEPTNTSVNQLSLILGIFINFLILEEQYSNLDMIQGHFLIHH